MLQGLVAYEPVALKEGKVYVKNVLTITEF